MTLLVSSKPIVVFCKHGIHSFSLEPGIPADVPEIFVGPALTAGARLTSEPAPVPAPADASINPQIEQVGDAIRLILQSGVKEKLEQSGIPRLSEIEALCGFKVSRKLRDAAWNVVEEG